MWKFVEILTEAAEVFGSQDDAEQWMVRSATARRHRWRAANKPTARERHYPMEEGQRAQEAAIQVLREAGFEPDGKAWGRPRFVKPGSKRKATVGPKITCFYEVPAFGKMRTIAMVPTPNLERIEFVACKAGTEHAPEEQHKDEAGQEMARFCFQHREQLKPHERKFIDNMILWAESRQLTDKQRNWLRSIYQRIGG